MYNNIKLEKGLYSITGKTFTQALAELDPDANYENTELKGLDAFERQLKRFDIKVKGANSDRVEKFFISTESAVLFPEYIRRTVKQGMDEASIMGEFNMTTMICTPDVMAKILAMDEMKYCIGDYMAGGTVQTPYGVTLVKCPQLTGGIAVGIDQSSAVEMVLGGDVIVDYDKLLTNQCNEIVCSVLAGFSVLTSGAVKTLKTTK